MLRSEEYDYKEVSCVGRCVNPKVQNQHNPITTSSQVEYANMSFPPRKHTGKNEIPSLNIYIYIY